MLTFKVKRFMYQCLFAGVKNPVYQHSLKMAGRGRGMPRKWCQWCTKHTRYASDWLSPCNFRDKAKWGSKPVRPLTLAWIIVLQWTHLKWTCSWAYYKLASAWEGKRVKSWNKAGTKFMWTWKGCPSWEMLMQYLPAV